MRVCWVLSSELAFAYRADLYTLGKTHLQHASVMSTPPEAFFIDPATLAYKIKHRGGPGET